MVLTNIMAAKMPKWLNAVASRGMRAEKAPTVVMLPTTRGEAISSSVCRGEAQWARWVTKCRG